MIASVRPSKDDAVKYSRIVAPTMKATDRILAPASPPRLSATAPSGGVMHRQAGHTPGAAAAPPEHPFRPGGGGKRHVREELTSPAKAAVIPIHNQVRGAPSLQ